MNNIVAVDVDDVLVHLVKRWVEIYNKEWDDNLDYHDIHSWMITDLVKPECGLQMLDILNRKDLYDGIEVVDGAVEGIARLRELDKRVVYVTAGNHPMKEDWLKKNGFLYDKQDYIVARDKSLINAGYLLDDGFHNVKNFRGMGYLFTRPWNLQFELWELRVNSWDEFIEELEAYDEKIKTFS